MRNLKYSIISIFVITSRLLIAQDIITEHEALAVMKSGIWASSTCDVCWQNPDPTNATERNWVRQAIANTWEKESGFKFTGWGTCNSNSKGIKIQISDERPHTIGLGKNLAGLTNGMVLNFTFNNWETACQKDLKACIMQTAVHEFGHGLGFGHEHIRTDCIICDIPKEKLDVVADWTITPCDLNSVMNYCNPSWNGDGNLSDLDIEGVVSMYGNNENSFSGNSNKNTFAINRTTQQTDIFWTGNDGKINVAWNKLGEKWDNQVYQINGIYSPPAQGTNIAVINRTAKANNLLDKQIDIYWIGIDGKIYAAWNKLGETWNNHVYQILGDFPTPAQGSSITCINRTNLQTDLYWIGNDGKIYAAWNRLGETWEKHIYQIKGKYPPPAQGTSISAINRTNSIIDLYWIGNDGKIYVAWNKFGETWDNHVYQIAGNYPPPAQGTSISSINRSPTYIDLYWIGNNGKIYAAWNKFGETWDNHVFQISGNYPSPARGTSISSINRSSTNTDLYWIGNDGKIYTTWNKFKEPWGNLISPIKINIDYSLASQGTSISSINRSSTNTDLYWIGNDGKIYVTWNKFGEPWDFHTYRITGNYSVRK